MFNGASWNLPESASKSSTSPTQDRSLVWKLTKQRYYGVPIIKDGKNVIFEISDDSQVIAKYLDEELELGLFPIEMVRRPVHPLALHRK